MLTFLTIYKYPLRITDEQEIEMPWDANILTVKVQNDIPCIWAEVRQNSPRIKRKFLIRGTGHEYEKSANEKYIDTFLVRNDSLVFHVFEKLKKYHIDGCGNFVSAEDM